MAVLNSTALDPAFQGVGLKVGMYVWRIDSSDAVVVPELQHGKFASRQSYIILNTQTANTGAGLQHHVHYWLGASTNNSDATSAAVKAVELGASLGGHGVVQYREVEGFETDRFLSYFKPCFIPIKEGNACAAAASWSKPRVEALYQGRLFICKGRHVLRVKEVPFARSSLTHDNVFVLDTKTKIFQFNGTNTDIYQRAKALDAVQYLQKNFHTEPCPVAIVEDGRFVADADSGDFWGLFGGFAPLGKSPNHHDDVKTEATKWTLFCINEGRQTAIERAPFEREMLSTSKCYILDCGSMWFTWAGRDTMHEERKAVVLRAEAMIAKSKYPHRIHLTCATEGFEPTEFKLKFESWPIRAELPTSQGGRGKVAELVKCKGVTVQGVDSAKQQFLSATNSTGKLQVWCVHKVNKQSVSASDHGHFYNDNAYIVLYTDTANRKDKHFSFLWFGNQTVMETIKKAKEYSNNIMSSLKGSMVEAWVFEGKEPKLFLSLFEKLVILKGDKRRGGLSLYQIQCCSPSNWQAIEVHPVATSLNSSGCFVLHVNATVFTWYGKFSMLEEQAATEKMVLHLKLGASSTTVREGSEPELFWEVLGGKQLYPSHRQPQDDTRDPHLFSCHLEEDKLEVEEVFNFTQEDLYSDEVMILDCFTDVFVWVGQNASNKNKLMALELGQQYLEQAAKCGRITTNVPLFKIREGNEPSFFTSVFAWDSSKSTETKPRQHSQLTEGKGFPSTDKARFDLGGSTVSKPEDRVQIEKKYTSNGVIHRTVPRKTGTTVSVLSLAFELQNGGGAPPNTPIVKQSKLSLKSRDFRRKESPLGTPRSSIRTPISATIKTPRTAVSPAIATLSSVFESYSDRFAFAWPGMQHRHEERTRRGFFDLDSPVTVSETDPTEIPYRRSAMIDLDEQLLLQELHHLPPQKSSQHRFQAALHSIADDDDEDLEEWHANDSNHRTGLAQAPLGDEHDAAAAAAADGNDNLNYPYERLKVSSANPVTQIDSSRREAYLSNGEFQDIFHMDKVTFYNLPKWKQDKYKVIKDLF